MRLNFKEFFDLMEIDVDNLDASQYQLRPVGGGYKYKFDMDGDEYNVTFYKYDLQVPNQYETLTRNAFEIGLSGPQGTGLTGKGKPMTVYKNLLGAVKQLIQTANPEGLHFFGAYPEQDIMYNQFYNKYLKSKFTQISHEDYVRNDFLEQIKQTKPQWWQAIQQSMQDHAQDNTIERLKQEKIDRRNQLLQLASQMGDAVGKIMWNPSEGHPALVTAINGITATCFGMTYNNISGRPAEYKATLDKLKSFKNLSSYYKGYVQQFSQMLAQMGRQAQEYMGIDAQEAGVTASW